MRTKINPRRTITETSKILSICVVVLAVLAIALTGTASAKSLYVIADIDPDPTPIRAYDIQGTNLVYQATHFVPALGWGAVGLAIDSDSETLFVTYESSNTIHLVDAKTFADLGDAIAPGALNLAGIVVDQDNGLVYTVDRDTDNLYVYNWDAGTHTLTLQSTLDLPNAVGLYGIALDEGNDLLYVADGAGGMVRYYDTSTWAEQGSFAPTDAPNGIAIDASAQTVYTVSGFLTGSFLLCKYELATGTETTTDMGHGGMDVAVDPATGFVYVSGGYAGDDVSVWDPSTLSQTYTTGEIGDPTGLCVPGKDISYNQLNLGKDDGLATGECVYAGANINYEICYDNTNAYDVHNVVITDTLPAETTFVSASDGGTYASATHTVTWNIGTLTAGAPQSCETLIVTVNSGTAPGTTITNSATIDSDDTPPTTQNKDTDVCTGPPPKPGINIEKWVKYEGEPESAYRKAIEDAEVCENVTFKIAVHNNGTNSNLTNILVTDELSASLGYQDNAEVQFANGTTAAMEPVQTAPGEYKWAFPREWLEPCEFLNITFDAHVDECGNDTNFVRVTAENKTGYGVTDKDTVWVNCTAAPPTPKPAPTGDATDPDGGTKDVYTTDETVYATGSGFDPDSFVKISITEDKKWTDGTHINSTIFATKTVRTNAAGEIASTDVWQDPVPGEYDIVFDADQDGYYNEGRDVVDHPNHPGFIITAPTPIPVPEFSVVGLLGLVGVLSLVLVGTIMVLRKRE